jgi:DNA-binding transcriptional ArsR family regulator
MSSHYHLTDKELADLEFEHRHAFDKRYADRVKAVYLLGKGWPVTKIAQALLIDRETVRNHFKRYRKGGFGCLAEKRRWRQRRCAYRGAAAVAGSAST